MRAPRNIELIIVAVVLLILSSAAIGDYYPAAHPVIGPDGSVLRGADGNPLVHRDMARYYRMMIPAYILFSCSVAPIVWLLVRLLRHLYCRVKNHKPVT